MAATPRTLPAVQRDAALAFHGEEMNEDSWHHFGTTGADDNIDGPEVREKSGEPSGTRTLGPLIKSRVPYL
jgi:hypothetical protein